MAERITARVKAGEGGENPVSGRNEVRRLSEPVSDVRDAVLSTVRLLASPGKARRLLCGLLAGVAWAQPCIYGIAANGLDCLAAAPPAPVGIVAAPKDATANTVCSAVNGQIPSFVLGAGDNLITHTCAFNNATGQWVINSFINVDLLKAALASQPQGIAGRYVRIQLDAVGYLQLAEVQITSPASVLLAPSVLVRSVIRQLDDLEVRGLPMNVPLFPATMSSTYPGNGGPTLAIDGDTNGNYAAGSVAHTNGTEAGWWEVDLAGLEAITSITIWNRTDCCEERLTNYTVTVMDQNRKTVWSSHQTTAPNPSVTIQVTP